MNIALGREPSRYSETSLDDFAVHPLTVTFGARLEGIDLSVPMDDGLVGRLREALRTYKVLVFPAQDAVGPDELFAFCKQFGEPETADHPLHPGVPGLPAVKVIAKDGPDGPVKQLRESWHTDGGQRENLHWLTVLQAKEVPPVGRDTAFCDMEAAFSSLSPTLQAFLEDRTAEHSWGAQMPDAAPVRHPLVIRDPTNGAKALYVNATYTRAICDMWKDESDALLEFLCSRTRFIELQLRVSWTPNMITMWDNVKVQHYLVLDKTYARTMHRVMIQESE